MPFFPSDVAGDDGAANSMPTLPFTPLPSVAVNTQLLVSILLDIGASEYLQKFIDDDQDDDCLGSFKNSDKISKEYGLPLNLASAFVEKCRASAAIQRGNVASMSLSSVSSPPPVDDVSAPVDLAAIMLQQNLEIVGELGQGGFGTVYKCRNLFDKLTVAVKVVKDPKNAKEAMREGQRLRRVNHKNIVRMFKVHDLSPILGGHACALEMEAVSGGDLFQHLEAARRRPELRLPRDTVMRLSRQLLEALVYLQDEMKWLHGDIKPQNILMQCSPVPADGSAVDYSTSEIKLADFGLAKTMDQQDSSSSFMLTNASTQAGVIKGTMWYLSPEALQGACSGYDRTYADDLWSACLVILEMDTGLALQQLMTVPGAVKIDELLTKASSELLPLLCSVLAVPDVASRCKSAAELLRKFVASIDPLFQWQLFDGTAQKFVPVHPASSFALEEAFVANQKHTMLPLQPPLDLHFDIQALLTSATALGSQTERQSGIKCSICRVLRSSVLTSSAGIPVWQELLEGREWRQCSPAMCAKLEIAMHNPNTMPDSAKYRRILLQTGSIGSAQLPFTMKSEPFCEPAQSADVAILSKRIHASLPEWDITEMVQVVNPALASKYAACRHQVAARCNGNPNERLLFHFTSPFVMKKIWQEGQGHDPRLSAWAEVGKGAYFSEHLMYGYAYKYCLWPCPPKFEVKLEPPIGETMQLFATLVCLGQVADVGPGCETCPSPVWDAWKKEFENMKSPEVSSPKPTRPPVMTLPPDADRKQLLLDLMQVKDAPRYDSVTSTEGDLAMHPASVNKNAVGQPIGDVMHPRLRDRAKEWAKQFVVFKESDSYPMFIITVTKNRDSPLNLRQVVASGYSALQLKNIGFTASQLKCAGCGAEQLKIAGFTAQELRNNGFSLVDLDAAKFDFEELKSAGFSDAEISEVE